MEELIAFCGIDCSKCPAFIAKATNDNELRKKTADEWSKQFGSAFNTDEINCDGCTSETDVHIAYCGMCEIRSCGIGKKVKNCAYCDEYPCDKLLKWFENAPDAKKVLDEIKRMRS